MENKVFRIEKIPTVIWGESSEKVIIAVHGNMSSKTDVPIEILAKCALAKNYQVLSFDLPEHGDRKDEDTICKPQSCVKDFLTVMEYAKSKWKNISLFANSMGAYFSLLAYHREKIERAWFLSPVVDMQRIIENMMTWFDVTEDKLKNQQTISTPTGQTLYWDYYCYVKKHPITDWAIPTNILYGENDEMCDYDTIIKFAKQFSCELEIVLGSKHYFHTPKQLQKLDEWLEKTL